MTDLSPSVPPVDVSLLHASIVSIDTVVTNRYVACHVDGCMHPVHCWHVRCRDGRVWRDAGVCGRGRGEGRMGRCVHDDAGDAIDANADSS